MTDANEWFNPFCSGSAFSTSRFDLSPCFQTTIIGSIPIVILALAGGLEFYDLYPKWRRGDRPERGGKAAFRIKVVSTYRSQRNSSLKLTRPFFWDHDVGGNGRPRVGSSGAPRYDRT